MRDWQHREIPHAMNASCKKDTVVEQKFQAPGLAVSCLFFVVFG